MTQDRTPADDFASRLASARAGDARALGQVLEGFRPYLLAIAHSGLSDDLRSKGGASDLVQESLLDAFNDLHRFVGDSPEDLRAWLRGILRHNLTDWVRRFRESGKRSIDRERPLGESQARGLVAAGLTPHSRAVAGEEQDTLDAAIARLPDDERTAVLLHNRDHLNFEAIGRRIGRSGEAARKLWTRAVLRLQRDLEGGRE